MESSVLWTETMEKAVTKATMDETPILIDFFNPE